MRDHFICIFFFSKNSCSPSKRASQFVYSNVSEKRKAETITSQLFFLERHKNPDELEAQLTVAL